MNTTDNELLTQENKAKFYSQYYGQPILMTSLNGTVIDGKWIDKVLNDECDAPIQLKSLSSISDEDAIEVYNIYHELENKDSVDEKRNRRTAIELHYYVKSLVEGQNIMCCPRLVDKAYYFLRSKGYALPFNGITVDQYVNAGWAVIKND